MKLSVKKKKNIENYSTNKKNIFEKVIFQIFIKKNKKIKISEDDDDNSNLNYKCDVKSLIIILVSLFYILICKR